MKQLLTAIPFFIFTSVFSQQEVTVKGDESINDVVGNEKFKYTGFTNGFVYFRDAAFSRASLNYNYLTGEMLFTGLGGDTLALTDEPVIKYITINTDTFYYDKVYLQLIAENTVAKLAKRETYNISDIKKVGAYGLLTSTNEVRSLLYIQRHGQLDKLTEDIRTVYVKRTAYYIGNNYGNFLPASKHNIYKLFGKHETALKNYFDTNAVAFYKEDNLKKLIAFLQTL